MPSYLVLVDGQQKIIIAHESYINPSDECILRNLTDCEDSELSGLPVFQGNTYIDAWPAEDELLSDKLIDSISMQLKSDSSAELKDTVKSAIYDINGKPNIYLRISRCPHASIAINKTRKLCITIIPTDDFFDTNELRCGDQDSFEDRYITAYYRNAIYANRLMPNHALYFSLIKLSDWTLSICEEVDYLEGSDTHAYLQTVADVKNNLINPYLELIQTLHQNKKFHGDPSPTNVTLSKKFKKLIFLDFKNLGESEHEENSLEWSAEKLSDFYGMASSILSHLPSTRYRRNPAIIYLSRLQCALSGYDSREIDEDEQRDIEENKELTIEAIIEYVNLFWSIPSEQLVDFPLEKFFSGDLSETESDRILSAYGEACMDNNGELMLFYETLFPQCRLIIGQIDHMDFASLDTSGFFPRRSDETNYDRLEALSVRSYFH